MANQLLMGKQYLKKFHEIYVRPETNQVTMQKQIDDAIDHLTIAGVPTPHFLKGLTVQKLETKLEQLQSYIAPRPFQLGVETKMVLEGDEMVPKMKKREFYYFNIQDTVIAVLRNKKVFDDVLSEQKMF